jgi:hypothetical protein
MQFFKVIVRSVRLRWIGPHDHLEKPHGRFLLI